MKQESGELITPMDVYDADGALLRIEGVNSEGNTVVDVVWDPQDEQTNDKRVEFRKWAYKMLNQMGYEVRS
jgi:hypothetical protein